MCENMVVSEVCAVSNGHYIESGNCSVSDEEKGRHTLVGRVSLFINCVKKIVHKKFYTGPLLSYTWPVHVWTCAAGSSGGAVCRISSIQSSNPSNYRMLKSW
jgi:hypothetical protein